MNEEQFISGDDSGTVQLWSMLKKKPSATYRHSTAPDCWISSVGAKSFSDICASGSCDGRVVLYSGDAPTRKFNQLGHVTCPGWCNGIVFGERFMAMAMGKEHRLGRWRNISSAINGVAIVALPV